jgi:hypothetical protein
MPDTSDSKPTLSITSSLQSTTTNVDTTPTMSTINNDATEKSSTTANEQMIGSPLSTATIAGVVGSGVALCLCVVVIVVVALVVKSRYFVSLCVSFCERLKCCVVVSAADLHRNIRKQIQSMLKRHHRQQQQQQQQILNNKQPAIHRCLTVMALTRTLANLQKKLQRRPLEILVIKLAILMFNFACFLIVLLMKTIKIYCN